MKMAMWYLWISAKMGTCGLTRHCKPTKIDKRLAEGFLKSKNTTYD
jgi:hypothetical protein